MFPKWSKNLKTTLIQKEKLTTEEAGHDDLTRNQLKIQLCDHTVVGVVIFHAPSSSGALESAKVDTAHCHRIAHSIDVFATSSTEYV
jgi:hypothetical protein